METYRSVGAATTGMSNDPTVETLHTVDDRSKVVAVVTTLIAFGAGMVTIGDIEFVSVAAAAFGIGVRFATVWGGARVFVEGGSAAIAEQPTAGSYHHGAIGIALAAAGGVALIARSLGVEASAVGAGAAVLAVVAFLGLSALLPD